MSRVFLPGFALSSAMYSRLDAARDSQCIDIDIQTTWEETIAATTSIVKKKSIAIGYSLGGRLALAMALENPALFSGLILVSTHAGLSDDHEREMRSTADEQQMQNCLVDKEKMFRTFNQRDIFDSLDKDTKKFLEVSRLKDKEIIAQQLRVLGLGSMPNYEQRLIELRIPVLYITGSRDTKFTQLNARYKKQTPFAHHRVLDSDHRIPFVSPRTLSLHIEWFANNIL